MFELQTSKFESDESHFYFKIMMFKISVILFQGQEVEIFKIRENCNEQINSF